MKKQIGMDKFKLRLDLEMPQSSNPEVINEEYLCDDCGEIHREGDCNNGHNMRTGPIPELENKEPVVPSTYIEKLRKFAKKMRKKK